MMRNFILIILSMVSIFSWGQTYSALWNKAAEAEKKDLPQTQREVLEQIVKKAAQERAFGQLMKAELKAAQVQASIAPDSLAPAVKRLEARCQAQKDEVLRTVYRTVLYQIYSQNPSLVDNRGERREERGKATGRRSDSGGNERIEDSKPVLTPALCEQLAKVKDDAYEPFVIGGKDSRLFGHDLLSIIGYALNDYQPLHDYYERTGNRPAACLTALEALKHRGSDVLRGSGGAGARGSAMIRMLDSLIAEYQDLPEAGELAVARYEQMRDEGSYTPKEKTEYARLAIDRWPSWTGMNTLRNAVKDLTNPQFFTAMDARIALPQRAQEVRLSSLRNLREVTMKVYQVKADGDLQLNPNVEADYKKLKPMLHAMEQSTQTRTYTGKADYELFDDTLTIAGSPRGVYMLEFTSNPSTETVRRLYHVTDVYVMAEEQPDARIRYVAVSATTGQPLPKARLRIRKYTSYNKYDTLELVADSKGECYLTDEKRARKEVFAYTDTDKASPWMNLNSRYNFYGKQTDVEQTLLLTDRSIYRPGQTVHAALTIYQVRNGFQYAVVADRQVTFTMRDANYKEVARQQAVTDAYGTCSVDLTLPASGLTGQFTLVANGQTVGFRVEEYKRPTFEVAFDEVKTDYESGDTVKTRATARSYAGVPVQGASVRYKVVRRKPLWWWSYSRYWNLGVIGNSSDDEEIGSGETTTADDGTFEVDVPMTLPKSDHPLFYNFVVTADVTDVGGETRMGQISLPIGNRKTALSIDVEERILAESRPTVTFHLRNAAGNDIDAKVDYRIDGGSWLTADTHQTIHLPALKSGRHTVEARYGETVKREFMIFSLDDKRPADETDDWFWVSDSQFPNDGKPVTVQVGSSREDVHIVYSIFSGRRCIESGAVDKSNELINRKLTYKEEWGDGILLTFAWVKENVCHTHSATIRRPLPDKHLKLAWKTFRDRLTPGQQEEWTLTVTGPDGKPADAMLTSVLYDKSLDQLTAHNWWFAPYLNLSTPYADWAHAYRGSLTFSASKSLSLAGVGSLQFSRFDESVYPVLRHIYIRGYGNRRMLTRNAPMAAGMVMKAVSSDVTEEAAAVDEVMVSKQMMDAGATAAQGAEADGGEAAPQQVQLRENLNETAFFYPQLTTDKDGVVSLKFTLPESLTTWRFMSLAHTKDMCYGNLEGEAVAKKDVMIQPNMPRFIREGDEATISARIFNTGEKTVQGKAWLRLIDPETDETVYETSQPFSAGTDGTASVTFSLAPLSSLLPPLSSLL